MKKVVYTKDWLFVVVCIHQAMALISSCVTLFLSGLSFSGVIALVLSLLISTAVFMKLSTSRPIMLFLFAFAVFALITQMTLGVGSPDLISVVISSALTVFYLFLLVSVTKYTYKEKGVKKIGTGK